MGGRGGPREGEDHEKPREAGPGSSMLFRLELASGWRCDVAASVREIDQGESGGVGVAGELQGWGSEAGLAGRLRERKGGVQEFLTPHHFLYIAAAGSLSMIPENRKEVPHCLSLPGQGLVSSYHVNSQQCQLVRFQVWRCLVLLRMYSLLLQAKHEQLFYLLSTGLLLEYLSKPYI